MSAPSQAGAVAWRELFTQADIDAAISAGDRIEYTAFKSDGIDLPASDLSGSEGWIRVYNPAVGDARHGRLRALNTPPAAVPVEALEGLAALKDAYCNCDGSQEAEDAAPKCDCGSNADNRWPHHDECAIYSDTDKSLSFDPASIGPFTAAAALMQDSDAAVGAQGEDFHDRFYGMKFVLHLDPNSDEDGNEVELMCGMTAGPDGNETVYFHAKDESVLRLAAPAAGKGVDANCWSADYGDTWLDCPDDAEFVHGLKVGDEYELQASVYSWAERYRVTKVPDDVNDDYEVERVSPPALTRQPVAVQ